jgi:hypothetical protein
VMPAGLGSAMMTAATPSTTAQRPMPRAVVGATGSAAGAVSVGDPSSGQPGQAVLARTSHRPEFVQHRRGPRIPPQLVSDPDARHPAPARLALEAVAVSESGPELGNGVRQFGIQEWGQPKFTAGSPAPLPTNGIADQRVVSDGAGDRTRGLLDPGRGMMALVRAGIRRR